MLHKEKPSTFEFNSMSEGEVLVKNATNIAEKLADFVLGINTSTHSSTAKIHNLITLMQNAKTSINHFREFITKQKNQTDQSEESFYDIAVLNKKISLIEKHLTDLNKNLQKDNQLPRFMQLVGQPVKEDYQTKLLRTLTVSQALRVNTIKGDNIEKSQTKNIKIVVEKCKRIPHAEIGIYIKALAINKINKIHNQFRSINNKQPSDEETFEKNVGDFLYGFEKLLASVRTFNRKMFLPATITYTLEHYFDKSDPLYANIYSFLENDFHTLKLVQKILERAELIQNPDTKNQFITSAICFLRNAPLNKSGDRSLKTLKQYQKIILQTINASLKEEPGALTLFISQNTPTKPEPSPEVPRLTV